MFPMLGNATEFTYVDVSQQLYTYEAMLEDMALLAAGHEDIMTYQSIATTSQGRNVWLIKFGNLNAENKILITASFCISPISSARRNLSLT